MAQVEYKGTYTVNTLYEYYLDSGFPTGASKPNTPGDPDYIPPVEGSDICPSVFKYTNSALSQAFTKNDCSPGQTGSVVTYTIPAGKYMADTQQEADALAALDMELLGQAYANANGTCTSVTYPYKWIAGDTECEKTFAEDEMFTGFGSPWQPYIKENNIMYVDSSLNKLYEINPATLTQGDVASIVAGGISIPSNPTGANSGNSVPTGLYYDSEQDLIFVQGFWTNGYYVIDGSTGSILEHKTDGISNGNYTRTRISGLKAINKALLGSTQGKRINLITREIDTTGLSFQSGTTEAYINNNKVYAVVELQNQIRVYNSTITISITTITNINQNRDEANNFNIRGLYSEPSTNRIYIGETSTTPAVRILNTITDTITATIPINKEGFARGKIGQININTITGDIWICGGVGAGTSFDDYNPRVWVLDRNTLTIKDTITFSQGVLIDSLIFHQQTNTIWVGSRGSMPYDGGSHATDGVLFRLGGVGENTGNVIVRDLLKVSDDANEYPLDENNQRTSTSGLPQDEKENTFGEEGYIPPYYNSELCPIPFNNDTELRIYFDSSGSMNTTLAPLQNMRDNDLKTALLPFYDGDSDLYDSKVTITNFSHERTFQTMNMDGATPSNNVIVLIFQDESTPYAAGSSTFDPNTTRNATFEADMNTFKGRLANFGPNYYRGFIFRVVTSASYAGFRTFLEAIFNGIGLYAEPYSLAGRNDVNVSYDITAASTPQYYTNIIINAINSLGYNIPPYNP